jgi:uncharacterized cupredoxin-like copper-binding protein
MRWNKKCLLTLATMTALVSHAEVVQAHGDETHIKAPGATPKEQKPWGIAGDDKAVRRRIEFTMNDNMRFTPDRLEVEKGETVRIVIRNQGKLMHEFVMGTNKDIDEHAALMVKFPNMEHDEPYMAHVGPGNTGEIVWTFNRAGDFDFACLIVGHFQAGMVGKIRVIDAAANQGERHAKQPN